MFKELIRCLNPGEHLKSLHHEKGQTGLSTPRIIPRAEHPLSRQHISDAALKVLYRLDGAGFEAFLVGGSIRDALLGKMPKDFDVATNATPEQVRELFRNSRLIGRRFRIVHVRFGRETIEVTTFRGKPQDEHADHIARQSDAGLLLRDNVWGSIEEDALRRDFTVNALYYNIADFSLHDFAGGVDDIETRTLRLIGDPETRYREDPVRMLRAVRFASKLDFILDATTEAPIYDLAPLLLQIPPARLFDEVLKLFMAGYGLMTFRMLSHYDLFGMLFPEAEEAMADAAWVEDMIEAALTNTDRRIADGRPVTPAFLLAVFLWAPVMNRQATLVQNGMPNVPAMQTAAQQVISRQLHHTSIPKRFGMPMRDIWELQERLAKRQGKRAFQTREHPRFRAAYDLLLLREKAGEIPCGLGEWWTAFQQGDEHEQRRLLSKVGSDPASQGKRRKRRRKSRPNTE